MHFSLPKTNAAQQRPADAAEAAGQALKLAKAAGRDALAGEIEGWLTNKGQGTAEP